MKFYVSALIAIVVFFVCASLTIDAATYLLGKPSRGVSYGIGIYYLNIALAVLGSVTLVSTKWFGRKLPIAVGAVGVCTSVFLFFAQPSVEVRVIVAVIIAVMLATTVMLLTRFTARR